MHMARLFLFADDADETYMALRETAEAVAASARAREEADTALERARATVACVAELPAAAEAAGKVVELVEAALVAAAQRVADSRARLGADGWLLPL